MKQKEIQNLIIKDIVEVIHNNNISTYPKNSTYTMSLNEKRELVKTIESPLVDLYIKNNQLECFLMPCVEQKLSELSSNLDKTQVYNDVKKKLTRDCLLNFMSENQETKTELIHKYFSKTFHSEFINFLCHYIFINKIDVSEFSTVKEIFLSIGVKTLLDEFPFDAYILELKDYVGIEDKEAIRLIKSQIWGYEKNKILDKGLVNIIKEYSELTGENILCSNETIPELSLDISDFLNKVVDYGLTLITTKTKKSKMKKDYRVKYSDCTKAPLINDDNYLLNLLNDIYLTIENTLKLGKYFSREEIRERLETLLKIAFQIELRDYDDTIGYHGVFIKDLDKFEACIQECLFHGIKWAITHTYITREITNELEKSIPKNPKDLYPETRLRSKEFLSDGHHYRHITIEVGPTNSGKTYNAVKALAEAESGCYAGPLRLLALEVQGTLKNTYGVKTSLLTGVESEIVEGAKHISCTVEKVDLTKEYDVVVIDEFQMVGDKDRGFAYSRVLLSVLANHIYVCTAPEALPLLLNILKDTGDEYEIVEHTRNTELLPIEHNVKFPKELEPGTAVVCFSKKKVLQMASMLKEKGYDINILYGSLPYQVRHAQLNSFLEAFEYDEKLGEYKAKTKKVLVCTDCISYGMNIPLKTVLLTETTKFNGDSVVSVGSGLGKQICGRASRFGYYPKGYYGSTENWQIVKRWVEEPTEPIEKAYIGFPDEIVLNLPHSLDEILKVWKNLNLDSDLYQKMDIERYLTLYNQLDFLTEEEKKDKALILKLLFIPFDEKNEELLDLWKHYISSYFHDGEIYFGEEVEDETDLNALETYYKKVDLFYSFCRNLNLFQNELDWVDTERAEVSDKINHLLIEDIVRLGEKHCRICGKKLPSSTKYNLCQNCFRKQNRRIW